MGLGRGGEGEKWRETTNGLVCHLQRAFSFPSVDLFALFGRCESCFEYIFFREIEYLRPYSEFESVLPTALVRVGFGLTDRKK